MPIMKQRNFFPLKTHRTILPSILQSFTLRLLFLNAIPVFDSSTASDYFRLPQVDWSILAAVPFPGRHNFQQTAIL